MRKHDSRLFQHEIFKDRVTGACGSPSCLSGCHGMHGGLLTNRRNDTKRQFVPSAVTCASRMVSICVKHPYRKQPHKPFTLSWYGKTISIPRQCEGFVGLFPL